MELPLFPLRTVVFPYGRIPLQIFEPRYMQLIKACIRDQSMFGVVLIRQGDEVRQSVEAALPQLAAVGTRVKPVDWFSLEHGMLGVVVEGQDCFRVGHCRQAADGLVLAGITMQPGTAPGLADEDHAVLSSLWQDLRRHPRLQELGYPVMPDSAQALLGSLLQVLPMDEITRYHLLEQFGEACVPMLKRWLHEQGVA